MATLRAHAFAASDATCTARMKTGLRDLLLTIWERNRSWRGKEMRVLSTLKFCLCLGFYDDVFLGKKLWKPGKGE